MVIISGWNYAFLKIFLSTFTCYKKKKTFPLNMKKIIEKLKSEDREGGRERHIVKRKNNEQPETWRHAWSEVP